MNRKEARAALTKVLRGALANVPAAHIYGYQPGDFGGRSPVVYVTSSGSNHPGLTGRGRRDRLYLNVHVLVLYSSQDANGATTYSEADAEDVLDEIEAAISEAMSGPAATSAWSSIEWADRSDADSPVKIGGDLYLHEVIPLVVE